MLRPVQEALGVLEGLQPGGSLLHNGGVDHLQVGLSALAHGDDDLVTLFQSNGRGGVETLVQTAQVVRNFVFRLLALDGLFRQGDEHTPEGDEQNGDHYIK